jgi:NAD(P)-dependent dehydrogenase (short-subunit alcohol dehydrogenase family)
MKTLVLGGTGFVGRRLVEILTTDGAGVTVLNRDAGKITRVLGLSPAYDLRSGHAQTLEWFRRSGAAVVDQALSDPLWGRTFDLAYEAKVAALARARGPANPAPRRPDGR